MSASEELFYKVKGHLDCIYPDVDTQALASDLISIMGLDVKQYDVDSHGNRWDEEDVWVITYGDSIQKEDEAPLQTLRKFCHDRLAGIVNGVHILPFFPYSSDDGFSVIDFSQVNQSLGDWQDIRTIAKEFHLMADLVVNHCSSRSLWFENFKQDKSPGKDYFITPDEDFDVSQVVRPRISPLLREVQTLSGKKKVWCTFSHDQVDLNYENPELLKEMVKTIHLYLENGVRIFRLDAVAFLWKIAGTNCIHLPQTHEMVRLFRTLIEHYSKDAIIITETNVPNAENLSYLGNANEAHAVYNFSLPPLLIQGLLSGQCQHLKEWLIGMPAPQMGTFYFNFLASHDGIGLRPAEGLLADEEINEMVHCIKRFGGLISWRSTADGQDRPYEMNITLYDALQGTLEGPDKWQIPRFLCAHGVMLALEGVPAIYIHSLMGTHNYHEGVEHTNHNRTINRYKWQQPDLVEKLDNPITHHHQVFNQMLALMAVRKKQKAFHPNAEQFILHICDQVFGFWRQSIDREQKIFCLYNFSTEPQTISLASLNLPEAGPWVDLLSDTQYDNLYGSIQLQPYQFVWLSNC
ncbi:alpha-amylase [Bermanella marisrubri]|uniref:Putative sucrose phosphorylase n=1 Tax=Bermanella marisrubri TaxID=207949 RepID=Q1MY88_9GAMM|nr:alpha-amylase family glycosyl hydrolase [Bermanella marisrubri]EAT10922.1 putative sucrose phosphorylase [Oceanobacter sp. RED65] [Bermanella marisrubri]QIZ83734.1 alpha-amylase [Bermanella marisrubri]